ncbi:MAG: hypothetical protein KGP35_05670 [Bacteroidetes bacterium]|nr:hypothetical protein [Bacteroidota bacterium]
MKAFLQSIRYSLPFQLLLMHFLRHQLLLGYWIFLVAVINGSIMKSFGGNALLLAPEYLGKVSFYSGLFTGFAFGIFLMSWNISSFLLFGHKFKFLAATSKPFKNYILNNALLPIGFICFYLTHIILFDYENELLDWHEIFALIGGQLAGFTLLMLIAFAYISGSESAIQRSMKTGTSTSKKRNRFIRFRKPSIDSKQIRVDSFFTGWLRIKVPRSVDHYNQRFLNRVFEHHHFAAFLAIVLAFFLLLNYGYFLDRPYFQFPAAASVFVFCSILISLAGALVYWMGRWTLLVIICIVISINLVIAYEVVDMRNKAFGLNYQNVAYRPPYHLQHLVELSNSDQMRKDSLQMITLLNKWKSKQGVEKPYLYLLNVSGGGSRSATFSFHTIRMIDSAMKGALMHKVFLFSGASGGMLGATYYRELFRQQQKGKIENIQSHEYGENISADLLNPVFSALVTRDLFTPPQYFTVGNYRYTKDRGYAFEEQFYQNTGSVLGEQLKDYQQEERAAKIPLGLFLSTVSQDGRKMMICNQPLSFLMRPQPDSGRGIAAEPDAVDFASLFKAQDPYNIRILTALRMNATFPLVLPNVWLPSEPVIDVMDAGMRDNYGLETPLRFISYFDSWIKEHTSGVILIQIRDHQKNKNTEIKATEHGLGDIWYKPATAVQNNFYMVQDYFQESMLSTLNKSMEIKRFTFMYEPAANRPGAALNFHLTAQEKKSLKESVTNEGNRKVLENLITLKP